MNAVAEARAAVSVALLGPADAAREQLRQALLGLGADLVFEGEVREGARLSGRAPQVLIVNLEPGVEDDLDALQDLFDTPDTAVVFNEGEVSSQLTGWDLARWARHLAAKVLGGRETLPPAPSGAERLPELTLLPEPGRPVSPSQQQDHLRFDDYAEEALGHSDAVPSSARLDLEPEPAVPPVAELSALDFDFSPVHGGDVPAAAEPPVEVSDDLESMDLSSLFEQSAEPLSPDDMLVKLQQAMGLESARPSAQASAETVQLDVGAERPEGVPLAVDSETPASDPAMALAPLDDLALEMHAVGDDAVSLEIRDETPSDSMSVVEIASLELDWDAPVAVEHEEVTSPPPQVSAAVDADVGSAEDLLLDDGLMSMDPPNVSQTPPAVDASIGVEDWEVVNEDAAFSFDPVAYESEDAAPLAERPESTEDSLSLDLGEDAVDSTLADFDFSAFDAAVDAPAASAVAPGRFDAEDTALGGTLTLESDVDDEEIARLAAALDEQPSLPSAVDLPPLEFDFARPTPPEAEAPPPPVHAPLATAASEPAVVNTAKAAFGELSLQPLEGGFIDSTVKAPEAPARNFDFSHLTLSLEPLEEATPAGPETDADGLQVATMRDGAWLRDIGDGPVQPAAEAPVSEDSVVEEQSDASQDFSENGYDFPSSPTAQPPPLPAEVATVAHASTIAPLSQGVSRVIVLCASIGGPDALRSFLSSIPAGFPALFVVVQHLENGYFERLAQQLQKASPLPVRVPMAGIAARDGEVLVVASGARFLLAVDGQVELVEAQQTSRYRPCIDDVLCDVADAFGPHAHAIIFSGMAADAIEGAVYLTRLGGQVWAQDPESCVVSSMVDGARSRGVVEFIGSPRELAEHCVRRFGVHV